MQSKPGTEGQTPYDSPYMRCQSSHIHKDRRWNGDARGWGWGYAESVSGEEGVSGWQDEEVLDMDGGDGRTTLWMYLMPLNRTFKKVKKMLSYMLAILTKKF